MNLRDRARQADKEGRRQYEAEQHRQEEERKQIHAALAAEAMTYERKSSAKRPT